jgi:hypothetical protein
MHLQNALYSLANLLKQIYFFFKIIFEVSSFVLIHYPFSFLDAETTVDVNAEAAVGVGTDVGTDVETEAEDDVESKIPLYT